MTPPVVAAPRIFRSLGRLAAVAALLAVAACSTPGPGGAPGGIHDPFEQENRERHKVNTALDKAIIRPVALSYAAVVPEPIQDTVSNFSNNLGEPSNFVNNVLQGNLNGAMLNTVRFVINSTLGFGGLGDVAGDFDIPRANTDFGQTLHVWGAPEGAYQELLIRGPSTQRDTVGLVVDTVMNPMSRVLPKPERYYGTAANIVDRVGSRGRFANTVDSILYDSADGYAQSRLIYLQSRRFALGQTGEAGNDDPYALGTEDPYDDPYAQ